MARRGSEADGEGRVRERDERLRDAGRLWGGRDESEAVGKADFPAWQSSVGRSTRSEAEPGSEEDTWVANRGRKKLESNRNFPISPQRQPSTSEGSFRVTATEDERKNPNTRALREAGRWGSQRPRGLVVRGKDRNMGRQREGRGVIKEERL